MSRAPSTPPARQYAPNEIPSPFLASGLAAPRAPLQPSDLYGAKLKATLNHVKSETAAMRSDIEGVLQIRDELDSLRNELTIVRQLVDTQGELLEKRVLNAVSTLFDLKFAPLFDSLLERSTALSTSFEVYESNTVTRARAQNGRIEEVEASNRRRLEEVEKQLASERANIKRDHSDLMKRVEERVEKVVRERKDEVLEEILGEARTEMAKGSKEILEKHLELEQNVNSLASAFQSGSPRVQNSHLASNTIPVHSQVATPEKAPSAERPSIESEPGSAQSTKGKEVSTGSEPLSTPTKATSEVPLDSSPQSPPPRRNRSRIRTKSVTSSQVADSRQLGASSDHDIDPSAQGVDPADPEAYGGVTSGQDRRIENEGKMRSGTRAGKRFIEQDLSQTRTRTVSRDVRTEMIEEEEEEAEPDTIE
ncbi:uncharacterized protein JCM6883_001506 [Sporobolomyces salmoneus]|uniref:uncharacterized protein n=1 Tax=Sporobolomyces salmoneus TaxID=183962 RepID=UPI003175E2B2